MNALFITSPIISYCPQVGTGGGSGGGDEDEARAAGGSSGTPSRQLLGRRDSTSFDTSRHCFFSCILLSFSYSLMPLKIENMIISLIG